MTNPAHRNAVKAGLTFALTVPTTGEVLGRFGDRTSALEALDASTRTELLLVLDVRRHLEAVTA